MSDPVESLKAWVDADEAEINKHPDDGDDTVADWQIAARPGRNYLFDPYLSIAKKRALREVESKREMLGLAEYLLDWSADDDPQVSEHEIKMMRSAGSELLRMLSRPYAKDGG